jgi:LysR family hydrogen peroxide-inducible transcriptional activator
MSQRPIPAASLRQLEYLVAVADLGGFRRAADACHVAQPSLSAQVAQVERALGVQIFERNRRGVRLAPAGAAIVDHARRVLLAAADLGEVARQQADPYRGRLRLGVIPTVCPYLLPELAPILTARYPNLACIWSEDRTRRLVEQVRAGSLDAAVLALESDMGDLESATLVHDAFVIAAAPTHPLVQSSRPARPDVLRGETVLLLEDGHCLRDQAVGLCARAGAGEAGYRATSLATLVQMVSASSAITLLPSLAVPVENRRGQLRIRPFAPPAPGRTIVLAWRRGAALADPLRKLADTVRTTWAVAPRGVRVPPRQARPIRDRAHPR